MIRTFLLAASSGGYFLPLICFFFPSCSLSFVLAKLLVQSLIVHSLFWSQLSGIGWINREYPTGRLEAKTSEQPRGPKVTERLLSWGPLQIYLRKFPVFHLLNHWTYRPFQRFWNTHRNTHTSDLLWRSLYHRFRMSRPQSLPDYLSKMPITGIISFQGGNVYFWFTVFFVSACGRVWAT